MEKMWAAKPHRNDPASSSRCSRGVRNFDSLFDSWQSYRGIGQSGTLAGSHERNPKWENKLVEHSMSSFPPASLDSMYCYRLECPLSCPNNDGARQKLAVMMNLYAALANPWEADFERRRTEVNFSKKR